MSKTIKGFQALGVDVRGDTGDQLYGICPFCDFDKKPTFYAHLTKKLWDCKHCGLHGNWNHFLELIAERNAKWMTQRDRKNLAKMRALHSSAFKGWGIGFDGNQYTLPIFDRPDSFQKQKVIDIRTYKPGRKRLYSTPGCRTGLFGMDQLSGTGKVYICEGEWDAIALRYLFQRNKVDPLPCIVGVPGANIFKQEWITYFSGREVVFLYDSDGPGIQGMRVAKERLKGIVSKIQYVNWPPEVPEGFDVTDWVRYGCNKLRQPKKCLRRLLAHISDVPKETVLKDVEQQQEEALEPQTLEDVHNAIHDFLLVKDIRVFDVLLASTIANKMRGDPLWLMLVGPPSDGKSEMIMSLSKCSDVVTLSSLSPRALISGFRGPQGEDFSLLPQLDQKTLAVKDMTGIIQQPSVIRDELFGQLRDAYDGKAEKAFGTGIKKYKARFGFVAGVTPAIYIESQAAMGERFLYVRTPRLTSKDTYRIMEFVSERTGRELELREKLENSVAGFLSRDFPDIDDISLPKTSQHQLIRLAQTLAKVRSVVTRDKYRREEVKVVPHNEIPTRIYKQLLQLSYGLCAAYGLTSINEEVIDVIILVVISSFPDRVEKIIHGLYKQPNATRDDLIKSCKGLSGTTVYRLLKDLVLLQLIDIERSSVKKNGPGRKASSYNLKKGLRNLIDEAGLY